MLQRRMPGRLMGSVPLWGGGLGAFKFDPALVTFTPGMAKRTSPGPFETAPIVQGKFDGSGVPDTIIFDRGDQISRNFYANIDGYQGSLNFWWIPEKDRDGAQTDPEYIWYDLAGKYHFVYEHDNQRFSLRAGEGADIGYVSYTAVAGTMVHLVFRWDTKNTLDGTNYFSLSINNVHTFVVSTLPTQATPGSSLYVGSEGFFFPANAIIEGETVYRRPLFDGTYGVAANWDDSGPIDEIEEIYNAGAGQDPCLITGSWDIVFCLPTDSTAGALVTGNGEGWSHPHSSGVLKHQWLEDGGYLGRPWAVISTTSPKTVIDCGSGATLDDICAAGADITVEAWVRYDNEGVSSIIICKGRSDSTAGWALRIHSDNTARFTANLATTNAIAISTSLLNDGKLHHVVGYYDDATKTAYICIDGVWEDSGIGVGAYQSDAALTLYFSRWSNINTSQLEGLFGWAAISDNDRYGAAAGTDFIPPRQPIGIDGNHVEMWHIDEGTGATANAEVTSPANDGTISNGTWEEQWDIETTPIVPYSLEFDGSATEVDCGSAADIDDIADNAFTVECWIRSTDLSQSSVIMGKGGWQGNVGWSMFISVGGLVARVNCATTDATIFVPAPWRPRYGKWIHLVITWDDAGDRKVRFYVDGVLRGTSDAGVGAVVSDAALSCYIGRRADAAATYFKGAFGWARISDNLRYTADFTPPSRLNPPASDGNTLRQFNFRDGAGATLTDDTGTVNGTITFGDGQWRITPDMEIDSPGERIFNWGYVIGNDAVDEGITQILSGLDAGENYVVRAIAHVESASRGRPKIIIYDETNGAEITSLEGPSFTGTHDGGMNQADMTDSTARFPQMLVGWTIYNIDDGSSATITAISGDMQVITGALSGGTDDDWDIGDEYRIVPPGGPSEYDDYPWIEIFTFELPTIARNGAAADCVSISLKLVNGVNEGVIKWHQVELLENLIDNPSVETGAGNPWIPDGWINTGLDAGDTVQELVTIHSGVGSMEWNAGAVFGEYIYDSPAFTADKFYDMGMWQYGDGVGIIQLRSFTAARALLQYSATGNAIAGDVAQNWQPIMGVWRSLGNSLDPRVQPDSNGVGDRFTDDIYCFQLDDVSLTVTPASEANSEENGGLRVDGLDSCTQPIPAGILTPTSGWIKFKYTPRHDAADVSKLGVAIPNVARIRFDGTRYIHLFFAAANILRFIFDDGGGAHQADWNPATLNAGTEYLIEIKYNASEMILKVDGVIRITITQPINFTAIPTTTWWGTNQGGSNQADAVFIAP